MDNQYSSNEGADPEIDGDEEGSLEIALSDTPLNIGKNDRSLSEFERWHGEGRLVLDPEWQRNFVWDGTRQSRFIESLLKNVPIPVIYLAKSQENKYEVIDGLQRLSTAFGFFSNKFALSKLELIPELNGKFFKDLPRQFQSLLKDTTLRTFELPPETPLDFIFILFERLNTGGLALNDMEIRNCLYRGPLVELIKDLAQYEEFKKALDSPNLSKRMKDRGLILRYLAFNQISYKNATRGLKRFLNNFLEDYKNTTPNRLSDFKRDFKKACRASFTVFGDKSFRLFRDGKWAKNINASLFQVIMVSFVQYDLVQITRRSDSIYEEFLNLITEDTKWLDSITTHTSDSRNLEYAFSTWQDHLKLAISTEEPQDQTRCFSRKLKEDLFSQSQTCAICNQRIVLIDDSALDHEVHYWRGGQTVPTNARLVHRICNLTRPH